MPGHDCAGCLLNPAHAAASNGACAEQWRSGRFRLSKAEVEAELRLGGLSEDRLLRALTAPARLLARPPISDFQVGCA